MQRCHHCVTEANCQPHTQTPPICRILVLSREHKLATMKHMATAVNISAGPMGRAKPSLGRPYLQLPLLYPCSCASSSLQASGSWMLACACVKASQRSARLYCKCARPRSCHLSAAGCAVSLSPCSSSWSSGGGVTCSGSGITAQTRRTCHRECDACVTCTAGSTCASSKLKVIMNTNALLVAGRRSMRSACASHSGSLQGNGGWPWAHAHRRQAECPAPTQRLRYRTARAG